MNNLKTIPEMLNKDNKAKLKAAELFVMDSFSVSRDLLYSRTRKHEVSHSRFMVFYILNRVYGWQYASIGRMFSMDHASVIYGVNFVEKKGYGESIRKELKNI